MEYLTSKSNPHIKCVAKLIKQKKERDSENLFVCEGARLCYDIVESHCTIEKAFITEKAFEKYPAETKALTTRAKQSWIISDEISEWLSDTRGPQGIFAVGEKLNHTYRSDIVGNYSNFVIMDNVQDSGNVGTILRTSLALGVELVIISSDSADIYSPKTLRASMGSVLKMPILIVDDIHNTIKSLQKNDVKIYATALTDNAKELNTFAFSDKSAILLGNEGAGLSENTIAICDESVIIPMSDEAESLNVSVAASIAIWEMTKN